MTAIFFTIVGLVVGSYFPEPIQKCIFFCKEWVLTAAMPYLCQRVRKFAGEIKKEWSGIKD